MSVTTLEQVGRVSLGYKSLQNEFFYLERTTVDRFEIEPEFLKPVFMLRDINPAAFVQAERPRLWLFYCQKDEGDLRGTGAYRYIQAMAGRSATRRKQAGTRRTIRETLEAQGGAQWYAPKAAVHRHRLWLRKAFNSTYAPFAFRTPVLVDQRCNSIEPQRGVPYWSLAAWVTSTLFAYVVEINGSASLGAGALDAPTKRLRTYPVWDLRQASREEHAQLRQLVTEVWNQEAPVDWCKGRPGRRQRRLDEWFMKWAGKAVAIDRIYADLRAVCEARIGVAKEKPRIERKRRSDSVNQVASSVAARVRGVLERKRFPEDFMEVLEPDELRLVVPRGELRQVDLYPLMDMAEVRLVGASGQPIYEDSVPWPVGEAIVRACLLGRREFAVSTNRSEAERALRRFHEWFRQVEEGIESAIDESALGTGYEEQLARETYRLLGLHEMAGKRELAHSITVS